MKKHIIVATLSLSILLLGGTTALAINTQSTQDQNAAKIAKQNTHKASRCIQEITDEFTDIQNDWSREEVLEARAKGFVTGYEDFTFRPNSSVSKLETLVLILNAQRLSEEAKDYDLTDEQEVLLAKIPDWGKNYVALALDKEIITAEELQSFNPQQAAKRYEVCMYMSRIIEDETTEDSGNTVFTDEDQIPSTSKKDVHLLRTNGVISGYPDGKFQPMKAVKRNELITMLNKLDDNCLQNFASSTVKGTVKEITAIDGGYAISVVNEKGETIVVNTNSQTKLIYKGKVLTTIDIESSLQVKMLLDQDGGAVLVRFMDAVELSTINDDLDDIDEIDELDDVDESDDKDKIDKHVKHNQNNKRDKLSVPDLIDELDEIDQI